MPELPVALVIGAASPVGRATALALAASGRGRSTHALVVADADESGGLETVRLLEEIGTTARFAACDGTDEDAVAAAVHTATEAFGRLDVLVVLANAEGPSMPIYAIAPDDWRRVFEANLDGTFYALRHALPHMLAAERGVIVVVAGAAGLTPVPSSAASVASQHAVVGLTRAVALEVAGSGIRVHHVSPDSNDAPGKIAETVASLCADRNDVG